VVSTPCGFRTNMTSSHDENMRTWFAADKTGTRLAAGSKLTMTIPERLDSFSEPRATPQRRRLMLSGLISGDLNTFRKIHGDDYLGRCFTWPEAKLFDIIGKPRWDVIDGTVTFPPRFD